MRRIAYTILKSNHIHGEPARDRFASGLHFTIASRFGERWGYRPKPCLGTLSPDPILCFAPYDGFI